MRVQGNVSVFAPLREDRTRTIAAYGMEPIGGGTEATWHEVYFYHRRSGRPTLADVRQGIQADINRRVGERIVSTLVWGGKPVWLSEENQMNWKAAYDRAVQTDGDNLPLKFKLGEQTDGTPVYHTFTSLNAFGDFWTACLQHIHQCLADGWQQKDAIDWSLYDTGEDSAAPTAE